MRLSHLTITGADDSVDPAELARISSLAPLIEWGLLVDDSSGGRSRFPSAAWRREFYRAAPQARRAAHVCGLSALTELADAAGPAQCRLGQELRGVRDSVTPFGRVQLNFDAARVPLDVLTSLASTWRSGGWCRADGLPLGLVTQHNKANRRVHELFTRVGPEEMRYPLSYSVLFDASGGNGIEPGHWPVPLPELRCGYAGGLSARSVTAHLRALSILLVPAEIIWIDVETGVRDGDRFSLDKVGELIEVVRSMAVGTRLDPGQHLKVPIV